MKELFKNLLVWFEKNNRKSCSAWGLTVAITTPRLRASVRGSSYQNPRESGVETESCLGRTTDLGLRGQAAW